LPAAERARLCYDLGNVAYREGRVLEAVGWYTASLRLRPRDDDAWANLEHVRAEAHLPPADRGDLTATLARVLGSLTPAEAEWLALGGSALWLALALGEAFRGSRASRRLAWLGAALAIAACAPWVWGLARGGGDPLLVVRAEPAPVHSEPREGAAAIAEAASGSEVERLDELPGWTKVRLEGGTEGWVDGEAVFALRR
jgi:hypothetical protein